MSVSKTILTNLPKLPGVYLFKDSTGKILYVGKAVSLRDRVSSYFQKNQLLPKTKLMIEKSSNLDFIMVTSELEALLLEAYLIKKYQPFFNIREKDDKRRTYIKITTQEEFPRVFITRNIYGDKNTYFGPFYNAQPVKNVLKMLRSIFPFDTQRVIGKKSCFWNHLGLCNPCPSFILSLPKNQQTPYKRRYRQSIKQLINVLSRKTDKVKTELISAMNRAAKSQKFEEAAQIRNKITKLEFLTRPYQNASAFLENPNLVDDIREAEIRELYKELFTHIPLKRPPVKIECFDASHTSMESPTVGMSVLINGIPEKNYYRKFRVRGKVRDDLSFLEEALRRRFRHEEWEYPDLLVIDGGKTQVKRAKMILKDLNLTIPIIGIVKPFDDVVIPYKDGFLVVRLKSEPALLILQRIRDEAHRFSRSYHRVLRQKSCVPMHN